MGVLDWILVVIRWGHAVSAVAWVGGGIFYLLVLRPAIRRSQGLPPETGTAIRDEFRGLVATAIAVLLVTGVILSVARLTGEGVTVPYAIVLGVKIALALFMFYVVRIVRRGDYDTSDGQEPGIFGGAVRRATSPMALLIIGVVVIGLSDGAERAIRERAGVLNRPPTKIKEMT